MAALIFIAGSVAAGVGYGGHTTTVLDAFGSAAGLGIAKVHIEGQQETSESAVLAALGIGPESSLITVDADKARANLIALPWIAEATIRKSMPGSVHVQIQEKTATALWQHGQQIVVIDEKGDVLSDYLDVRFVGLPLVVGTDANVHAAEILDLVAGFSDLDGRVKAAVFVGKRRWDLVLANGVEIRLPADGAREALARLVAIDRREDLLSRDVVSIDVRLDDRIAIRPTQDALDRADKGGSGSKRREARI